MQKVVWLLGFCKKMQLLGWVADVIFASACEREWFE